MEGLFPQSRFTTATSVTISLLRSALDWHQIGKFAELAFLEDVEVADNPCQPPRFPACS
jgi:hypothetical protein